MQPGFYSVFVKRIIKKEEMGGKEKEGKRVTWRHLQGVVTSRDAQFCHGVGPREMVKGPHTFVIWHGVGPREIVEGRQTFNLKASFLWHKDLPFNFESLPPWHPAQQSCRQPIRINPTASAQKCNSFAFSVQVRGQSASWSTWIKSQNQKRSQSQQQMLFGNAQQSMNSKTWRIATPSPPQHEPSTDQRVKGD